MAKIEKTNKLKNFKSGYKVGTSSTKEPLSVRINNFEKRTQVYFKNYFTKFKNGYELSASLFILFVACIFPFAIQPTRYSNITITKLFTFWIGTSIFCLLPGIHYAIKHWHLGKFFLWLTKTPDKEGNYISIKWKQIFRPYEVIVIAFMFWCFISMCITPTRTINQSASSGYIFSFPFLQVAGPRQQTFMVWFFYMVALLYLGRFYRFHKMDLIAFVIVCATISLYALFQHHGHDLLGFGRNDDGTPSYDGSAAKKSYFFATISQGDVAGTYLGMTFVFAIFFLFSHIKRAKEITTKSNKRIIKWLNNVRNVIIREYVHRKRPVIIFSICVTLLIVNFLILMLYIVEIETAIKPPLLFIVSFVVFIVNLFFIKHNKMFALLGFCLVFAGLYTVHTDGAFVGIVGAALLTPFFLVKRKKLWIPIFSGILIAIFLSFPILGKINLPYESIKEAGNIIGSCLKGSCQIEDSMGTGRIGIWRGSIQLMNNKPITYLTGYGPGNFGNVTAISGDDRVYRADEAHNEFLHTLFEQGFIGLILELLIFAFIFVRFSQLLVRNKNPWRMAVFVAMMFSFVQMFFDISTAINDGFVWSIVGMSAGISYRYLKKI